jgi:glycerol uptake operon antiterminator
MNRDMPRVIPALRALDRWTALPDPTDAAWVFLLGGSLRTIGEPVGRLQRRGWRVFVHVDMLRGLEPDLEGLRFLAEYAGPDGIITTHSGTVVNAKKCGLASVQRIFLLDSQSVATGVQQARAALPDAVETLPGVIPEAIARVSREVPCPVIAGGLITRPEQVRAALAAGARSISTSTEALWAQDGREHVE